MKKKLVFNQLLFGSSQFIAIRLNDPITFKVLINYYLIIFRHNVYTEMFEEQNGSWLKKFL